MIHPIEVREHVKRHRPPRATMLTRVNGLVRLVLFWFFAKVVFGPRQIEALQEQHEESRVVYVLHRRGLFDFLYFNYAFLKHKLPIARWSNGRSTFWLRPLRHMIGLLFKRRSRRAPERRLKDTLITDESALLFLHRGRPGEVEDSDVYSQPYIKALLELQRELDEPIRLVPLLVVWERRNEGFRPTLLDEVFGPRQSPGFLRKAFHLVKNLWQPFFMMGAPIVQVGRAIDLKERLQLTADDVGVEGEAPLPEGAEAEEEASAIDAQPGQELAPSGLADVERAVKIRLDLEAQLEAERAVILGPRAKGAPRIKRELAASPRFQERIREIVPEDEVEPAMEAARKNLDAIAADPSMLTLKILGALLTPVWSMIYDGLEVDEDGLERVRELSRDSRIVVIPSHKSHIDYLIISYLFFQHGLIPPHIAAGDNLNFPPIGGIFRRAGAFFLRRAFRDDPVYAHCLKAYIAKLLEEGYPVEFFIEGGRSRTGKLLSPRFGMLKMILDGYLDSDIEKLAIVPCSVTYERIVEASSYQRELAGGKKKKENLGALIRSTQVLTSRFGRLHVTFGDPIDVGSYMARYDIDAASSSDDVSRLTQRLGYRVIYEINQAAIVAPSALTALVLLNNRQRGMGRERLLRDVGFLLHLLLQKGIRLSPTLRTALASKRAQLKRSELAARVEDLDDFEHDFLEPRARASQRPMRPQNTYLMLGQAVDDLIDEAIKLFSEGTLIEMTTLGTAERNDPNRFFYNIPENARVELSFYKNNILHAFVPETMLATALLEPRRPVLELGPAMERTLFLSKLFKYEFFYEERAEFENVFWRAFDDFEGHGWIRASGRDPELDTVELLTSPPTTLEFFHDMILTFLEAYELVAAELSFLEDGWRDESDYLDHLTFRCQIHYHEGRVRFLETLARPTFKNALKRFLEWDLLEIRYEQRGRKSVKQLRLAPDAYEAGEHRRLAERITHLTRGRRESSEAYSTAESAAPAAPR